jgi:prepilin-type N-terminal cleavage/methylation domain-containing protein
MMLPCVRVEVPFLSMRRLGFTLLELVVVLVVTGILLGLALPHLSAMRNRSAVRSAMGELGASFSTARGAAIARRASVAVVLDTAMGAVEVRSGGQTLLRRPLRSIYGVVLSSNRDSAVYDPRGLGYGVTNLTVVVRRGGMVDTLTMSRLGRVRW